MTVGHTRYTAHTGCLKKQSRRVNLYEGETRRSPTNTQSASLPLVNGVETAKSDQLKPSVDNTEGSL